MTLATYKCSEAIMMNAREHGFASEVANGCGNNVNQHSRPRKAVWMNNGDPVNVSQCVTSFKKTMHLRNLVKPFFIFILFLFIFFILLHFRG